MLDDLVNLNGCLYLDEYRGGEFVPTRVGQAELVPADRAGINYGRLIQLLNDIGDDRLELVQFGLVDNDNNVQIRFRGELYLGKIIDNVLKHFDQCLNPYVACFIKSSMHSYMLKIINENSIPI